MKTPIEAFFRPGCEKRSRVEELAELMRFVRSRTIQVVENSPVELLDYKLVPAANTLGMLLRHVAALWTIHYVAIFEGRDFSSQEWELWRGALTGPAPLAPIRGHPILYYCQLLEQSFEPVHRELTKKKEDWLYLAPTGGQQADRNNFYYLFHLVEDELGHLGQIRMIKRIWKSSEQSISG